MTTVGSTLCWKALILILVIGNSAAIVWNGDGTDTRWALQCDFIGRDFKNQISPGDRCGSLCKENSPCSHFTWTNYNGGTCWMKSGSVSEFDAVSKTNDEAVCGFLQQTNNSGWKVAGNLKWASNCEFMGRDMMAVASTAEQCREKICQSNPECSHFTWTNYQGGTCWLKKNGASDCDVVAKTDSGAECGFKNI
ncbi:uncharacterized protein LOC124205356 [Daphnia pulex]|uniref:uncharacterized protein LOC124205356 n=1 Tax=Daphnia pulex TaxID=6669 RepID=UPI001EDD9488|nr:uncharacterized protein LOC124205356 [Daphnia pulex]